MFRFFISVVLAGLASIFSVLNFPIHILSGKKAGSYILRNFYRLICFVNSVHIEVEGLENIEPGEKYLIVANHQSIFDIPVIGAAFPSEIRIFAKKELGRIPVFGQVLYMFEFVMVDRQNKRAAIKSLREAAESLERYSFLIFPEGTRSEDGGMGYFKTGGISIAQKNNIRMLPVAVQGTRRIMKKGELKVHPAKVKVKIFEPVSFPEGVDRQEMAGKLQQMIASFAEQDID